MGSRAGEQQVTPRSSNILRAVILPKHTQSFGVRHTSTSPRVAEGAELDIPHCTSSPQHDQAQRQETLLPLYISECKFQDILGSLAEAGQQGRGPGRES